MADIILPVALAFLLFDPSLSLLWVLLVYTGILQQTDYAYFVAGSGLFSLVRLLLDRVR